MRSAQQKHETAMDYMRRIVNNLDHEYGYMLDELPTTESVIEYFELAVKTYDTEFWAGILEAIENGQSPDAAIAFIQKYNLPAKWLESVHDAVNNREDN